MDKNGRDQAPDLALSNQTILFGSEQDDGVNPLPTWIKQQLPGKHQADEAQKSIGGQHPVGRRPQSHGGRRLGDSFGAFIVSALAANLPLAATHLIQTAKDNGGYDNVSVILAKVREPFPARPANWWTRLVDWLRQLFAGK